MSKQEGAILIQHISARAEIARGPSSNVWIPHSANGWPVEPLAVNVRACAVFGQEAEAGGVALRNLLDRCRKGLKDRTRRVSQRAHEFHERAVLPFVIWRTRRATLQLLRAEDRLKGSGGLGD